MASWQPATPEIRVSILEVIGKPMYPFLLTNTAAGYPYSRPLICINDGFRVRLVTRAHSHKMGHLERNPHAGLLWVDGQRSVLLQGTFSQIHGEEAIADFYSRYRLKNPARTRELSPGIERVILDLTPTFCRADWFAGFTPVVLRGAELL